MVASLLMAKMCIRDRAGKIHRILPALAISKSADFSMGTGMRKACAASQFALSASHRSVSRSCPCQQREIDFGTNFICGISLKVNTYYQRKSGNTPRRSRYACRACSRSSALGAVLYFAYSSCRTKASSFCSNPCRLSSSYSSS